jgi:hypothetical protein
VLLWTHTGYLSLDHVDGPVNFEKREPNVVPFSYKYVIKPDLCNGLIGNPTNEEIWGRYLDLAKQYDCILISQLSHGGYMRLRSWDQTLAMLKQPSPQNRGYFFFCEPQGTPSPLDKPDAAKIIREFKDRFVQSAEFPERGHVLKIVHPADGDRPFVRNAASHLVCRDSPTHGSKGLNGVKPGQTLHWSVLLKTEDIQGEHGAQITFVWDKARGAGDQPTVLTVTGTQDWKRHEGAIVVPEETVAGRVYLSMRRATGTAFFDDFAATVEGSDKPLVENGSFEKVTDKPLRFTGWIIDDDSLILAHWRAFCEQEQIGTHLPVRAGR